ncbi:hypothetical protein D3C81_1368870 [compost metagenome]
MPRSGGGTATALAPGSSALPPTSANGSADRTGAAAGINLARTGLPSNRSEVHSVPIGPLAPLTKARAAALMQSRWRWSWSWLREVRELTASPSMSSGTGLPSACPTMPRSSQPKAQALAAVPSHALRSSTPVTGRAGITR